MANKIKLLSDQVINQIAAGEVVDRPASVVKELVENSLDAGARRITVEVEQGGRRLVRVTDDGCGMSRDDALLSLERHATSKVEKSPDLFNIRTLGFRGEALPSIASVSDVRLITREQGSDIATRIEARGGVIKTVTETGAPVGAEIEVKRLFYNVPARRKFLKSVTTEFGHVSTLVSNVALARPDVHVSLYHNGKEVFDLPQSVDLSGRLRHALGRDAMRMLSPVDRTFEGIISSGDLRVYGYVSRPSYTRSSTRSLHLFVNRRFVRDRLINHAVFEAYRTLLPKGRYPLVVLFLDLPPEAVDVNVHPAKHEIRFRQQVAVHDAVIESILEALARAEGAGADVRLPRRIERTDDRDLDERAPARPTQGGRSPSRPPGGGADPGPGGVADALRRYYQKSGPEPYAGSYGGVAGPPQPLSRGGEEEPGDETPAEQAPSPLRFSDLRVIGQAGASYILAEAHDSIVIIDQHAAHERIMFEKLRRQFRSEKVLSQPLLFPLTVELTRAEAQAAADCADDLLRLGFEVEPFGGDTVAIKAVPALLADADPARLLLDVIDRLEDRGSGGLDDELDELFSVMACHSVVRARERMSVEEMSSLLRAMDGIEFPAHCPHGRDAVVRIKFTELDKRFGR